MSNETARDVSDAWRRVGQYLQAWGGYGTRVARRNEDLWAAVDQRLSKPSEDKYTVDDAADSMFRVLAVAQQNLEDLWFMMTRPVDTERYVKVLPTAFLFFDVRGDPPARVLTDPVDILVPADVERDRLPEKADIALDGTSTRTPNQSEDQSEDGVKRLTARLHARLQPGRRSYRLETVADDTPEPIPGTYDGLVYLKDPPLPLANLRILVEGPPPSV